ncbi:MAG: MFS transporter [Paludibacter sp.]|nr:MFS transporter [Paludibacter sp.]
MSNKTISTTKPLVVLCIAAFMVPFMGSSLNLAARQISEFFSMNAVTLTWVSSIYLISTAIFQIPFARIADIVGRKKMFLWGVLVFSICTFVCAFAPNTAILLIFRFFSGLGSAMLFGTNMAILTSLFPPQKRGMALGINTAVVYAALATGPLVGGILTNYFGWQSIFIISAIIGLSVVVLGKIFLLGEWIEAKGEKFDIKGTLIYAIALSGLIYGFSKLFDKNGINFVSLACLLIGIFALLIFILIENRMRFPIFNIKLFSGNRVFALSSLAALINYSATSATVFMISLYLQYVRGFEAANAGIILISQAGIQSVFSLLAGKFTARFEPSTLATTGMSIIVVALVGLSLLSPTTSMWLLIIWLMLLGAGFGIFSSPNVTVIMNSVDKKYYGQASATTGTMRLTGQAFSMGIASMAMSLFLGDKKIIPELYPNFMKSFNTTFIIFAVLCLIGVYASSVRNKKAKK